MTIDPEAPPCPYVISTLLGEYEVLEVSVPLLHLPVLLLLLGLLEEMSSTSDPLMNPIHAAFPALMLGLTPPISFLPSPSASAGLLITLPLVPSLAPLRPPCSSQ